MAPSHSVVNFTWFALCEEVAPRIVLSFYGACNSIDPYSLASPLVFANPNPPNEFVTLRRVLKR